MKKSEIMLRATQAAEALDAQGLAVIAGDDGSLLHYAGMCRMLRAMGGEIRCNHGKHAVSLFGLPYITADGKGA